MNHVECSLPEADGTVAVITWAAEILMIGDWPADLSDHWLTHQRQSLGEKAKTQRFRRRDQGLRQEPTAQRRQ